MALKHSSAIVHFEVTEKQSTAQAWPNDRPNAVIAITWMRL